MGGCRSGKTTCFVIDFAYFDRAQMRLTGCLTSPLLDAIHETFAVKKCGAVSLLLLVLPLLLNYELNFVAFIVA